jgi:hypothetical protein
MKNSLRALEALRSRAHFEVVEAGAAVSAAAEAAAGSERAVERATERTKSADAEVRRAIGVEHVNPALIVSLRRLSRIEHRELSTAKVALERDRAHEEAMRTALADLRNRERSLERALEAAHEEERRSVAGREIVLADEAWLQRSTRGVS